MTTIRNSKPEDDKGIANVLVESYNIDTIEEGIQVFKNETKKQHYYIVAEKDGNIIGITTWLMHGLPKHGLAELDRIAVLPDFRGKGVAKLLSDELKKQIQEHYNKLNSKLRKLYLLTHDNNERAKAFYNKMGFTHTSTLKQHYYKDKDEYVYSIFFD
tara:strand:+ start:247 stop:720 length:474 start_codon:yes stop_codon:yes gene_type:complete